MAEPWFRSPDFDEWQAEFSPDVKWIAYTSNETSEDEVWVGPYPKGKRIPISIGGGHEPAWDPNWGADGGDLYYRNGKNFMKVEIKVVNSRLVPSLPQQLFKDEYLRSKFPHSRNYDIGKDGRFLMIRPAEKRAAVTKFTLIVNWFEELKAKVPTSFLPKVDNGPR